MTYSDTPPPKDDEQSFAANAVSLEQLLSLGKKSLLDAEETLGRSVHLETGSPDRGSISVAAQLGIDVPTVLVIHDALLCGDRVKTKLQCVGADVNFEWVQMDAQIVEHVHIVQPYAVLIHFASAGLDVAAAMVKLLQQSQPHLPILALGSAQDPQSMLFALRAGVQDFLDIDAPDQSLIQSFKELLVKGKPQHEVKPALASAPLAAILSSRAGAGSSLLAAHVSVFLQQAMLAEGKGGDAARMQELLGVLLLDLGAPAGDGALYLDLVSEFDFIEAVQSLRRFDQKMASAGLTQHSSGLRLLSLPRQGGFLREVAYAEADLLVQRLSEYFRYIVADLGGVSQTNLAMRVALKAKKIWIVCEQSLPSVVSTTELVRQLEVQKVDRSVMELIVCRYDRNLELSAQHIAGQLQLPLLMTIPERRVELLQAVNQGQLLSPQIRRDPYVQAVHKLVDILLQDENLEGSTKKGVLSTLLQRMKVR